MGFFDRSKSVKRPLIASAGGTIKGGSPATPDAILRRTQDWQLRVLSYQDSIPEVGHAGTFVENIMGKVSYTVLVDGEPNETLTALLKRFPSGRAARSLLMVGEYVLAFKYDDKEASVKWKVLNKRDYKVELNKPLQVRTSTDKYESLDSKWSWFRVWRPDPSLQYEAWSSHKPMLDVLEALYVHQLADTAVATSRLAGAGILYIPNDEFVDMPDLDGGEPEPGSQAHFEMRLRDAMQDSLRHRNGDDAVVPLVMFGSAEYADAIKHVLMERRDDADAFASRINAYRKRYGGGIELPEEVITGMGDTNHWAGWKVDQNTWSYYLEPMGEISSEALDTNFITPIAEGLNIEGDIEVVIDPTRAIVKPDRTDAAIRLFSTGALSGEGALHYAGMDEKFIHPSANDNSAGKLGNQPDGQVRMPSSNFRDSEGEPVGDRNLER
jgi:hypothetical protein